MRRGLELHESKLSGTALLKEPQTFELNKCSIKCVGVIRRRVTGGGWRGGMGSWVDYFAVFCGGI